MARFTGGGSGSCGFGGGETGATRPRTAETAADRRVITAPHAEHSRPPWFTASQTVHLHTVFTATGVRRACPAVFPAALVPGGPSPRARLLSSRSVVTREAPAVRTWRTRLVGVP